MNHSDASIRDRAFAVMGIAPGTDERGLKYAYYRLMFQYHPDRNPEHEYAHEITSLISEAFQVLSGKKIKPVLLHDSDLVAKVAGRPAEEIKGMMTYDEWLKNQFYNMEEKSIWSY